SVIAMGCVVRMVMLAVIGMMMSVSTVVRMIVAVVAEMVLPAAKEQRAYDVHGQPERRDRDCLVEADGHRPDKARQRLIADQNRDDREHDGAGEAGEVTEFAGAEAEAIVAGMAVGEAQSERREQKCARNGRRVQHT